MVGHNRRGPPLLRAGGGPSRAIDNGRGAFARKQAELGAVAINPWGARYGATAAKHAIKSVEESIGGILAAPTRDNYDAPFREF